MRGRASHNYSGPPLHMKAPCQMRPPLEEKRSAARDIARNLHCIKGLEFLRLRGRILPPPRCCGERYPPVQPTPRQILPPRPRAKCRGALIMRRVDGGAVEYTVAAGAAWPRARENPYAMRRMH